MAGLIQGSKGSYVYISDDGNNYGVELSNVKALTGGFSPITSPAGKYPYNERNMRHVRGVVLGSGLPNSAPAVTVLPIAHPDATLFIGSTTAFVLTYPWGSLTYGVTGIFGERRPKLMSE